MELQRSVLLPYAVQDMFDIVEQAEHYPKFLPWCTGVTIFERSEDWVAARIDFAYLKLRFGFRTRNPKQRPQWLHVRLVEGPFKHFQADWAFTPLGTQGCKVQFAVTYEIADKVFDGIAAPAVDLVTRKMVDAFVKRADETLKPLAGPSTSKLFAPAQARAAPPVQAYAEVPAPAMPAARRKARSGGTAAPLTEPELPMPATPEITMPAPNTPLQDTLATSALAEYLKPDQVAALATVVRLASFASGAVLAPEGAPDNHLYVVVTGQLGVVSNRGTAEESTIATLGPGEFAHELGFLDGTARYATLVATRDAQVLVLEREGLEQLIDSHPRVVYGVMRAIVRAAHRHQTRIAVQGVELTNYVFKQHGRY